MAEAQLPAPLLTGGMLIDAAVMTAVFLGLLFAGSMFLPGRRVAAKGADGKAVTYRLNGLALYLLTALAAVVAQLGGWFSLSVLYSHFLALFAVANLFAFAFSGWLFRRGAREQRPSGFWRGFYFGTELNPSLLGVDLKLFSYRPSLIALALFNASFAAAQYEAHGQITSAMALYQAFSFIYVLNYFQFEGGMLRTWDIVSERFGWMLVWGDYALVPFFYCIAGWWLVDATGPALNPAFLAGIALLFAFGFWLFRGANAQKDRFKRDPGVMIWGKPAESLDGRLLVSGFWGIGRHLNYTGEICIYLAFALTTGFASFAPYLLPAWVAALLLHRSRRDERRCQAKYGELWTRYKQRVPRCMIPLVY